MRVVLISLQPEKGKRRHFGRLSFQKMFNFGLLSLASAASEHGHEVEVWDIGDSDFAEGALTAELNRYSPDVVGLSCISGFSYPSLLSVSAKVRSALPASLIVTGGMDHVGRIPEVTLAEAPSIDAVVSGYGEVPFVAILTAAKAGALGESIPGVSWRAGPSVPPADVLTPRPPDLRYELYRNLKTVPASVELARGCPFECSFCVSAGGKLVRREPADLAEQMLQACLAYDDPLCRIYLEAPLATYSGNFLQALRAELRARGINPTWRAECRVDTMHADLAEDLYAAGCRALDIGLESGSPRVLDWMCKAANPQKYLQRASEVFGALSAAGVFSKVNILFYAGESAETMNETYEYLTARKASIGAIAAGPLYLYPGIGGEDRILSLLEQHGGSIMSSPDWAARHMRPVNPSRDLTFERAAEIALAWEQEFQSAYRYWYHRRWGYFSPHTSYAEFVSAVQAAGVGDFPFPADTLGREDAVFGVEQCRTSTPP